MRHPGDALAAAAGCASGAGGSFVAPSRPIAPDTQAHATCPPSERHAERDRQLAAWLKAAAGGDARAFEQFYDSTVAYAQALLRRMLSDADAEDMLAEGYFQAWREAARFDPGRGSAVTWLLTLLRSRALDLLRRRRLEGPALDDEAAAALPDEAAGPAALLLQAQQAGRLQAALAELDGRERWVLALAYYRELSHAQIAQATGWPLGTVKSMILRAQHKLRSALADISA